MPPAHLDRAVQIFQPLEVVVLATPLVAQGGDDGFLLGEMGRQGGGGGQDRRMSTGGGDGVSSDGGQRGIDARKTGFGAYSLAGGACPRQMLVGPDGS
jgi:hypothetical protein